MDSDRKRADTTQGNDRRVARSRAAAGLGGAVKQSAEKGQLFIERDKTTGEFVYRIIDRETGELIRQWPREEVLRMREALEAVRGALLDRRV